MKREEGREGETRGYKRRRGEIKKETGRMNQHKRRERRVEGRQRKKSKT